MATTILVTCPECNKQIKAPSDLQGKKIRCKACDHVFTVKAAAAVKAKAAGPPAKPKAKEPPTLSVAAEEDDLRAYLVNEEKLPPRCPQCAEDLEGDDIVICLNCGYNLQTRAVIRVKRTIETTALDWILWLGPAVFALLFIAALIGFNIFYIFYVEEAKENDHWFKHVVTYGGVKVWVVIFTLFAMFTSGLFAFKRLVLNFTPPEKEK